MLACQPALMLWPSTSQKGPDAPVTERRAVVDEEPRTWTTGAACCRVEHQPVDVEPCDLAPHRLELVPARPERDPLGVRSTTGDLQTVTVFRRPHRPRDLEPDRLAVDGHEIVPAHRRNLG